MTKSAYSRRNKPLGIIIALIVVVATGFIAKIYLDKARDNPLSEDAVLTASVVNVAPAIAGRIASLRVTENQSVAKGELLFSLDAEPYRLAVEQARADLQFAEATRDLQARSVDAEKSNSAIALAQVARARTNLALTEQTLSRLTPMLPKGYVSAQQVDEARTARDDARTSLDQAVRQSEAAESLVSSVAASEALVEGRRAALAIAERGLANTQVLAPHDGRVVGLTTASGEFVVPGQSLFTLIDTSSWYASASFPETELPSITVGDCASVYALADRKTVIKGTVQGIGWGVISEDLVNLPRGLPYVPKSLNWVRIVQRFPVRILLENPPENLMRMGASAVAIVHSGRTC